MGVRGRKCRCPLAAIAIVLSFVLGILLPVIPAASAASASTVTVLRENFENPNFNCNTGWDQDGKEIWVRGDSNPDSGVDTWCHSTYRVSPSGNTYSLWCAVIGSNSIAPTRNLGIKSNTEVQRYDANMSAYIRHSLNMDPGLGDGTLSFIYWSKTMASSVPGGYDHLSVSVSADNSTYTTVWTQPSSDESSWRQATATIPVNAKTISFDFISGPYILGTEWQEGAYIDNILVTQVSDASWSHVGPLPSFSKGTFDIEVSIDTGQGVPESVKLYYRSSASSSYSLYTDASHPDGSFSSGEVVHFDSSLTGGERDYQFYSIASGGGVTEKQPSVPDASTSVDATPPQTASSVNRTAGASGWYDGPVKVRLTASDARSGVGSVQYRLDNGAWAAWGGDMSIASDGAHNLTYHAVDVAGNVEGDHTLSINIDGTAPVTAYSLDGDGTLRLLATDNASGVSSTRYRIDGGEWQNYGSPVKVLNSGYGTLEYYSVDVAGNTEAVNKLDLNDIPMSTVTLTIGGLEATYSQGETVKLSWTCSDPDGIVDHYEVLVDGVVVKTLDRTVGSFDLTGLSEGQRSITVRAVDADGNSVDQTVALTIGSAQKDGGSSMLPIIAIGAVVAVGAVVGALFFRPRKPR